MSEGDHGSGQGGNEPLRYFVPGELIVEVKYSGTFEPTEFARNDVFHSANPDLLLCVLKTWKPDDTDASIIENAMKGAAEILENRGWVNDALGGSRPFVEGEDRSSFVRLKVIQLEKKPTTMIYLAKELDLRARLTSQEGESHNVVSVSLNWLWSGAPDNGTTGGPGSLPVKPVPDVSDQDFKFWTWDDGFKPDIVSENQPEQARNARATLRGKLPQEIPCQVEVIILDTIPPETALERWTNRGELEQRNNRLEMLIGHLRDPYSGSLHRYENLSWVDDVFTWLDPAHPYGIRGYLPLGHHPPQVYEKYDMSDHGLFIASIIYRIAPGAKIHMIEVLNKYGVGSAQALIWGLDQIYKCGRQKDARLIINSSLTIGFSPAAAKACADAEKRTLEPEERFLILLERMARFSAFSLSSSVENKYKEVTDYFGNAISVAAAGNDNMAASDNTAAEEESGAADRSKARFPAAYGNVIGVGALTEKGEIARYSNVPDLPAPEGFYAFGGDVSDEEPKENCRWKASKDKGILGLYTHEKYQGELEVDNTSGWARWAGTSFATAVVTGVLAQVYECEDVSSSLPTGFLRAVAEEKYNNKGQVLPVGQGQRGRNPNQGTNTPNAPTRP